jgi:hypothetical protein
MIVARAISRKTVGSLPLGRMDATPGVHPWKNEAIRRELRLNRPKALKPVGTGRLLKSRPEPQWSWVVNFERT